MTKKRFTDKWIQSKAIVPETGRAEYSDGLCPGLHLRVTYQGRRTFSAMFRVNGRLMRHTIGPYPVVTLGNARAAALEIARQAQAGVDSREHRKRESSTLTYVELVDSYVEKHLKPSARSWKNVRASLRQERLHHLFRRRVVDIGKRDIMQVMDQAIVDGVPQAAVNQLRYLKMLFNWALGRDLVDRNPCEGIKPPGRVRERDRVLSDQEIGAIWRATNELPTPYAQMYRMFFLTGQRRSEVAEMSWSEVVGDLWTIPRERVKKDRAHAVPLTATAMQVLRTLDRHGDDAFVFTTTAGQRPSSNFHKTKQLLDDLSGTSGWTIHDIRRTVRSKLAELGVPEVVARKVTNHEAGKIDRIYNRHEYLKEKREALAKWEANLTSLT